MILNKKSAIGYDSQRYPLSPYGIRHEEDIVVFLQRYNFSVFPSFFLTAFLERTAIKNSKKTGITCIFLTRQMSYVTIGNRTCHSLEEAQSLKKGKTNYFKNKRVLC